MNGNGRLSPPVISKLPLGLLGYLGIKSGGAYPQSLGGTIQPVLPEVMRWLACAHREVVFDVAIPVTGLNSNQSTIVVPQTELWYLDHVSGAVFTDAAETIFGHVGILQYQGPAFIISDPFSPGSSSQQNFNTEQYLPQFMGPGDRLTLIVDTLTGAPLATNAQLRASIVRMPI